MKEDEYDTLASYIELMCKTQNSLEAIDKTERRSDEDFLELAEWLAIAYNIPTKHENPIVNAPDDTLTVISNDGCIHLNEFPPTTQPIYRNNPITEFQRNDEERNGLYDRTAAASAFVHIHANDKPIPWQQPESSARSRDPRIASCQQKLVEINNEIPDHVHNVLYSRTEVEIPPANKNVNTASLFETVQKMMEGDLTNDETNPEDMVISSQHSNLEYDPTSADLPTVNKDSINDKDTKIFHDIMNIFSMIEGKTDSRKVNTNEVNTQMHTHKTNTQPDTRSVNIHEANNVLKPRTETRTQLATTQLTHQRSVSTKSSSGKLDGAALLQNLNELTDALMSEVQKNNASSNRQYNHNPPIQPDQHRQNNFNPPVQPDPQHCPTIPLAMKPDFISNDPLENADNYHPEWQFLRSFQTDEQCLSYVKQRWGNSVSHPSIRLTSQTYRKYSNGRNSNNQGSRKRKLSGDLQDRPSKRLKLGTCLGTINGRLKSLEQVYNSKTRFLIQKYEKKKLDLEKTMDEELQRNNLKFSDGILTEFQKVANAMHLEQLKRKAKMVHDITEKYKRQLDDLSEKHTQRLEQVRQQYEEEAEKLKALKDEDESFNHLYVALSSSDEDDSSTVASELRKMYDEFGKYY